jgi:hypothetical protein
MKIKPAILAVALAACSHGDPELRTQEQQARSYREAYESQMQQVAQLKARIAELERRDCR